MHTFLEENDFKKTYIGLRSACPWSKKSGSNYGIRTCIAAQKTIS